MASASSSGSSPIPSAVQIPSATDTKNGKGGGRRRKSSAAASASADTKASVSTSPDALTYIAGDIGGTNSRLQLFQVRAPEELLSPGGCDSARANEHETLLHEHTYPSQKYASLTFVIQEFLKEASSKLGLDEGTLQPVACCLAVAGPVRANKANITNVSWQLDGAEMSKHLNIPDVLIINDFVGIGYGLLALERKDILAINDVPMSEDAPKACLGAGTGLGEVYLTAGHMLRSSRDDLEDDGSAGREEAEYNVWASEGGHADFAPRDALEFGLLEYFKKNERVTRVSVERIVSGLGLPKIYDYFTTLYPAEVNPAVTERLRVEDPGKVIGDFAARGECTLCLKTVELFVKCYGAEAGNLALKTLPFGGLFIAGGIAGKLQKFLTGNNLFYQHFVQKGRMQTLLEKVPVFLIKHEAVGLLGAKVVCRRLLRRSGFKPGRGELSSFSEATPRAGLLSSSASDGTAPPLHFAYPPPEDPQFETEVTLDRETHQPEKVVIRRRAPGAGAGEGAVGPSPSPHREQPSASPARHRPGFGRRGSVSFASDSTGSSLRTEAFRAGVAGGVLGGVLAGVVGVVALMAMGAVSVARRSGGGAGNTMAAPGRF